MSYLMWSLLGNVIMWLMWSNRPQITRYTHLVEFAYCDHFLDWCVLICLTVSDLSGPPEVITLSVIVLSSVHLWTLIIIYRKAGINWRKNASKRFETKTKQEQNKTKQKAHTLYLPIKCRYVGTTNFLLTIAIGNLRVSLFTPVPIDNN
jgi:hypothetical protein